MLRLQVNHLGGALISLLLLPKMVKTPESRITLVSSMMHYWVSSVPEVNAERMLDKLNDPSMDGRRLSERYSLTKCMFSNHWESAQRDRLFDSSIQRPLRKVLCFTSPSQCIGSYRLGRSRILLLIGKSYFISLSFRLK